MTADPDRLDLSFPPLQPSDLDLLREWLNTPHVSEWWGVGATPDGTAGIDLLIGDVSCIGRGVGSAAIRAYADTVVFAEPAVHRCVGAPDVRNGRSIRAFEKAGFRFVRDAVVSGEAVPEHVMVLDRNGPGSATPTG